VRDEVPDAIGEAIVDWTNQNDPLSRAEFDRLNSVLIRSVGEAAEHEEYGRNQHLRRTDAETAGVFTFEHDVALAQLDDDVEYVDLHGYALEEGFVPILVCLAGDIDDVADRQHRLYHLVDDTSPCECRAVTDGGVPLKDRVSRFLDRHPDASIPMIAGGVDAPPSAVAEVLDENTSESGKHSSSRTGDRISRPSSRSRQDRLRRSCNTGQWEDADFPTPESGIFPPGQFERVQWMGHQQKKPFAPWGDRDAPVPCSKDHHPETAADCECDARYKWGYNGHYRDGKTAQMAEVDPRLDGLAYIQLPDDPYVYVDGDDVRDPETGDVHPAFVAMLEHLGLTYADISQSGNGVHAIYKGDLPDEVKQASWRLDEDSWGSNEDLPSIEVYSGKRVCVMTGAHVPGTPTEIAEWNDEVLDPLLEANNQVATNQRDNADRDDVSTTREDYDIEDYKPTATTSAETTDDIRDVFGALDRLDARRVAERTIVDGWNDDASTSEGYRAFAPTWGPNSNGTANIVNDRIWQDTGDLGGYGGPVTMAAIDADEISPANASPVDGSTWWQGVEHLRDLGFDVPEYKPAPDPPEGTTPGGPPEPKRCEPPAVEFEDFDREQRWENLQGDRFEAFVASDGPTIWADHAGAGKTTNAGRAAAQRERGFAALFDKHEKAREFVLDGASPAVDFHLKGGAQKQQEVCMDADHADEQCPEHPGGDCPHMCPIYDLAKDDDDRQRYEAVVRELGPVEAHMILDLPFHDEDGSCPWFDQFGELEGADRVVGVHEYQLLKTVRDGRDVIVDESPSSLKTDRAVDMEGIARTTTTLDAVAALQGTPDALDEFARFTRDILDALAGDETPNSLADLDPPDVDAETYYEPVDPDDLPTDVDSEDVERRTIREQVGMPEGGTHRTRKEYAVERSLLAETFAQAKLAYNETIVNRMRRDEWDGTPLCFDALLAAAAAAGADADAARQAIALPTLLEHCPWCGSDLHDNNGERVCSDEDCDWHEDGQTLTQRDGERARAIARIDTDRGTPTGLAYHALPLASDLPDSPLILDATATPAKVAALYDVPEDQVAVDGGGLLESNLHLTQVLDGQYHCGTIERALERDGKLAERIQRTIDTVGDLHQCPLVIGPKTLLDRFSFPDNAETLYYHAARGLNRVECDAVVCIGAPHANVDDLRRDAELLAQGNDDVRAGGEEYSTRQKTAPPVWRTLCYEDDAGDGRAIPTKHFSGLVGELWRETREKELVQAVHRIRPLLADQTKHAYLLTNVPTNLPVDELATFEELADPLEAMLPVPEGAVDLLEAVYDVAAGGGPDGFRADQLVDERDDGTIANKVAGYHRLARLSGLDVTQRTVYNWVNALKDVGLLEPERYEQHAGVSYTADFATLKSALSVLSSNGGFKVAAKRRLRALLNESGSGLDWLAWARDIFDLRGSGSTGAVPPDGGGSEV
jgi:hypothetical protein